MKVIIRQGAAGLEAYIPKKDLEAKVTATDPTAVFGGELTLTGGVKIYIEPQDSIPDLPITLEARKV
jgi:nitrogen fixation protein NifT